jgi:hypothetical protein
MPDAVELTRIVRGVGLVVVASGVFVPSIARAHNGDATAL